MNEVIQYLKDCKTFYLATCEDGQPRVRPFGVVAEFEGKMYLLTGNRKAVFAQMIKNPKIEISGSIENTWLRIEAEAYRDVRREARVKMLEDNPELCAMYAVDDGNMEVLYLKNGKASFCSYTEPPRVVTF